MSALRYLIDDPAVLAANWEQSPFVSTSLPDLSAVLSLETVEALVCSGTLPLPCVRLFRDGEQLSTSRLGRFAERGGATRERLTVGSAVLGEVADGATLVVEELQTYCPQVAEFAAAVTEQCGYSTYCAAFITPADSRGVAPHYDTASVFIRQLDGSKRWVIARPAQRWPVREWSAKSPVDTEVVLDVELRAGQCLYVPRGFVHSGTATGQASAHLSIGLVPPTWANLLRRLTELALADESFREALPYGFHAMDAPTLTGLLAKRMAELTGRLSELAEGTQAERALAKAGPGQPATAPHPGSLRAALGPGGSRPGGSLAGGRAQEAR